MADNPIWKTAKPFVNGGLSGMAATCIIQPIDMVKVRLQLGATGGPVSACLGPGGASCSGNGHVLAA
jgi:solute carrier family 25 oxoglutarate transporter 11